MTDREIIAGIIHREGGYTNRADDAGGPTNMGITLKTLAEWRGHPVAANDVQNLTRMEAEDIYAHRYIGAPGFDKVHDSRLRALLVDSGVLCGPANAVRFLQRALHLEDDGVFGSDTRGAVWTLAPMTLYYRVCAERLRYFGRLISGNVTDKDGDGVPDNTEFTAGWLNRLADFIEENV